MSEIDAESTQVFIQIRAFHGGSSWLGTVRLVDAALELTAQMDADAFPKTIYLACGIWGNVDRGLQRKESECKEPGLELHDGSFLRESNAILTFLADGTPLLPRDRLLRRRILQWQFFEKYSHEPYIAVARFIANYLGTPLEREEKFRLNHSDGGAFGFCSKSR